MITVVVGKEIEKIKGDFESYLNGLNMVGEISYSQYSELYDEGVKQIQRAYELGKSELEKENAELKVYNEKLLNSDIEKHNKIVELNDKLNNLSKVAEVRLANWQKYEEENAELKRDKSELCNAINEAGKACVKLNEKLSKAKGFIEKLLIVSCNSEILIQYPNCKEVLEARVALEQFLMEK